MTASRRTDPQVGARKAVETLLAVERFHGQVWDAHYRDVGIMTALSAAGLSSFRTTHDFLGEVPTHAVDMPNVITEPPSESGAAYALKALEIVTGKVALLLPTAFLSLPANFDLFDERPPNRVYLLRKRPVHRKTPMAWLVWEKGFHEGTKLRWV